MGLVDLFKLFLIYFADLVLALLINIVVDLFNVIKRFNLFTFIKIAVNVFFGIITTGLIFIIIHFYFTWRF